MEDVGDGADSGPIVSSCIGLILYAVVNDFRDMDFVGLLMLANWPITVDVGRLRRV